MTPQPDSALRQRARLPRRLHWLLACLLVVCGIAFGQDSAAPASDPEAGAAAAVETDAQASARDATASADADTAEVAREDAATAARVTARLRAVDGLQAVNVVSTGGVVKLEGSVLDEEQRKLAQDLATKEDGVVAVQNRVELSSNFGERLDAAMDQVVDKFVRLLAAIPLLLLAIAIVFGASWLGKLVSRRLRLQHIRSSNPYMDGLIRGVVRTVITLMGALVALDLLGATALVGAVLGSAGVVGLVVGFAFKDIAENYIAGILLSLRRPFAPGEHVVIDSFEGKVVSLDSRATVLMTLDGNQLRLPNGLVFKSVILNYSQNPRRRFDFSVSVDSSQSIRQSRTAAMDAICKVEGVLGDPAPSWTVVENGSGGIVLRFFGWVDQRTTDLGKVRSEAIRVVKAAFAREGIIGPRTTYHLVNVEEPAGPAQATPAPEPEHGGDVDTSVNTEIDDQLAAAQDTASQNLLEPQPEAAAPDAAPPAAPLRAS